MRTVEPDARPLDCARGEDILMLRDILPTAYEVGVLTGNIGPGDVVAVVGTGPLGLPANMGARLSSPAHIEAVGVPESFDLWTRDTTITIWLVDTYLIPTPLDSVASEHLDPAMFITHHFNFKEVDETSDIVARNADTSVLEVIISART